VKFIGQKIKYMGEVHFQTTTQLIMSPKLLIVTMSSQTTKKSCQCSQMKKKPLKKKKTKTKNKKKKKKKLGVADSKKSNYLTDVQVL
jgi:hypothetical protein